MKFASTHHWGNYGWWDSGELSLSSVQVPINYVNITSLKVRMVLTYLRIKGG